MDKSGSKELYRDALYCHLLDKGYPEYKAKILADRMSSANEE